VKIATEVSKSFDSIAGSAKKVNDLIAEIAAASGEQSQGIDQVNTAVAQMDKVTQQNAANSEESASAAEEMSSQSEELQSMVAQFRLSSVSQKRTGGAQAAVHQTHHTSQTKPSLHEKQMSVKAKVTGHGGGSGKGTKSVGAAKTSAESAIPLQDEVLKEF
jgi:methyl-accepting chemotaxis protein